MIEISVIVPTFKRCDYLPRVLQSLCEQNLPSDQYEIVVVDNACESAAEQIVNEFKNENLNVNLRYVPESEVGLNRARNTGLNVAAGRYVAYIDDDARADGNWLRALVNAFEQTSPAPAAVGGRVWLDWQGEKPSWVPERHISLFTYVDHGEEGHPLCGDEYLVGANLAFDKEALKLLGGFDPNLDRQGSALLSGGDTAAVVKLQRSRKCVYYEPAAVVWHSVLQSRKRPTWLLKRLFWDGATQPLLDSASGERSRGLILRSVVYDLRQCAIWLLRALTASISGRKSAAWQSLLGLSQRAGRVRTQIRMLAPSESISTQRLP